MKQDWERNNRIIEITEDEVISIFDKNVDNHRMEFVEFNLLDGGLRNSNYHIKYSDSHSDNLNNYLLRAYYIEDQSVDEDPVWDKEMQVVDYIPTSIPIPTFLALDNDRNIVPYPIGILEFIKGTNLSSFIHSEYNFLNKIIYDAGKLLGKIHSSNEFSQSGFLDHKFDIHIPLDLSASEFLQHIEYFIEKGEKHDIRQNLLDNVRKFIEENLDIINEINTPYTICHGDYNVSNILVDTNVNRITGILDWEFVFSGFPMFDISNFLRYFDLDSEVAEMFINGYQNSGMKLPKEWKLACRMTDTLTLSSFFEREKIGTNMLKSISSRLLEYTRFN